MLTLLCSLSDALLQPFNSPEEALGEPSMQQVRDGLVREMLHFNPEIQYAQLPMMVQYG